MKLGILNKSIPNGDPIYTEDIEGLCEPPTVLTYGSIASILRQVKHQAIMAGYEKKADAYEVGVDTLIEVLDELG